MTSSVTMAAPSWVTVASEFVAEQGLQFNGFGTDGSLWVIGTSNGPYMLDSGTGKFFPLIPEIDTDDVNCVPASTVVSLDSGVRAVSRRSLTVS